MLFLISTGVLGLIIGSFLNVAIIRIPAVIFESDHLDAYSPRPFRATLKSLMFPRSHCPHCKNTLPWFCNIPLLSFIFLKGKCYFCQHSISPQYPLIELLTALLSILIAIKFNDTPQIVLGLCLTWALIVLSVIDIKHFILPDVITIPCLWLGLLANAFNLFTTPTNAIIGAIAGYLTLWLVFWIFKWATQKDGLGYGDFTLLAMLGAWLGWEALPITVLISSLFGSIVGLYLILIKKRPKDKPLPFGPFLAIGGFLALLNDPIFHLLDLKWLFL